MSKIILQDQINIELCNQSAFNAYNSLVSNGEIEQGEPMPESSALTFEERIMKDEEGDKFLDLKNMEGKIKRLEKKLEKHYNTSVTPFTDQLSRSFVGGQVGYMNGAGAKRKDAELKKQIEHSRQARSMERELTTYRNRLKSLKKGKIIRPNGLSVESYRTLTNTRDAAQKAIDTKTLKGKKLSSQDIKAVKELLKSTKRKIKSREKMYKKKFKI